MNKILLKREIISNKAILGILYKEGKEIARTLENPDLGNMPKISCIPTGTYKCVKDNTGKFQWWKVLNVKGRRDVEIHQGNTTKDTEGCIIIGQLWGFYQGRLAVLNSVKTLEKLIPILGEEFKLTIE